MTDIRHEVTAQDLRALAVTDRTSLLRDADTLVDSDEGIILSRSEWSRKPLAGRGRLTLCRLLYTRERFVEDGILIGKTPRTIDGSSLDERLADIAAGLNTPAAGSAEQINLTGKAVTDASKSALPGGGTASGQPGGTYAPTSDSVPLSSNVNLITPDLAVALQSHWSEWCTHAGFRLGAVVQSGVRHQPGYGACRGRVRAG